MSRLLQLVVMLLYCFGIITVRCADQSYFCDSDRFPLVTDLGPEDCEGNFAYREDGGINGCFPGCVEVTDGMLLLLLL